MRISFVSIYPNNVQFCTKENEFFFFYNIIFSFKPFISVLEKVDTEIERMTIVPKRAFNSRIRSPTLFIFCACLSISFYTRIHYCNGFTTTPQKQRLIGKILQNSHRASPGFVTKYDGILKGGQIFIDSRLRVEMSNGEESKLSEETQVNRVEGEKEKIEDNSKDTIVENDNSSTSGTSTRGSVNEYSFFDEAVIYVRAGSGGQGGSTYKKGVKGQNTLPDGENGGKGGDVLIVADQSLNTLAGLATSTGSNFLQSFRAENGQDGDRQFRNGRYGNDITIRVPPGTIIEEQILNKSSSNDGSGDEVIDLVEIGTVILPNNLDDENNDEYYYSDSLKKKKEVLVVARGGEGGEGSASSQAKGGRGVRRARAPPVGGERKRLKLTLKIVADVALVGVPNAGKSTFLASVTRAKPKIANVSNIHDNTFSTSQLLFENLLFIYFSSLLCSNNLNCDFFIINTFD